MSSYRIIKRLKWAQPLAQRPDCIPASRPRGAKAAGLRYERALAKHLSEGAHGVWFEFQDDNGHGYCQSDHLYSFLPNFIAILEVKYTLVLDAYSKLRDLYIPVISTAMKAPAVGIIVVKNLVAGFENAYTDLPSAALASYETDYPTVLHWRGQPLMPHTSTPKTYTQHHSKLHLVQPAKPFSQGPSKSHGPHGVDHGA